MLRDAVERRERFEAAHPDVKITAPGGLTGWWIADVPEGSVRDDPERAKVTAWQLADLMDALERIWPPGAGHGTSGLTGAPGSEP
jgi:hypothetical protein